MCVKYLELICIVIMFALKSILLKYDRLKAKGSTDGGITIKQKAFNDVINNIDVGINEGRAYEVSHVKDFMNELLRSSGENLVSNKEISALLKDNNGNKIRFYKPKQGKEIDQQTHLEELVEFPGLCDKQAIPTDQSYVEHAAGFS